LAPVVAGATEVAPLAPAVLPMRPADLPRGAAPPGTLLALALAPIPVVLPAPALVVAPRDALHRPAEEAANLFTGALLGADLAGADLAPAPRARARRGSLRLGRPVGRVVRAVAAALEEPTVRNIGGH